ncbi:MAG: hypothetical protein ACP5D5_06750 [Acidithiobacillus sp.]|jgi:hypothetical protein|uniref:hypothetical protein n=1 Tax=Acidithiobacillus sp. TaxID=1872118 RepID=UPI0025C44334|nr:hypothetical protein [Acidithiobacillus sp.]
MRKVLRAFLLILGIFLILSGLLFFLQGTGVFPYPRSSFMINKTIWEIRGALILALGAAVLILRSLWRPRP